MRGSCLPHAQFLLQYLKFSLRYTMGNMFGMFLFAFWEIGILKCEAVNFLKFEFAGIPIRPFEYLSTPILIIAYTPCMHTCDAHAHCDAKGSHMILTMSPSHHQHLCSICSM